MQSTRVPKISYGFILECSVNKSFVQNLLPELSKYKIQLNSRELVEENPHITLLLSSDINLMVNKDEIKKEVNKLLLDTKLTSLPISNFVTLGIDRKFLGIKLEDKNELEENLIKPLSKILEKHSIILKNKVKFIPHITIGRLSKDPITDETINTLNENFKKTFQSTDQMVTIKFLKFSIKNLETQEKKSYYKIPIGENSPATVAKTKLEKSSTTFIPSSEKKVLITSSSLFKKPIFEHLIIGSINVSFKKISKSYYTIEFTTINTDSENSSNFMHLLEVPVEIVSTRYQLLRSNPDFYLKLLPTKISSRKNGTSYDLYSEHIKDNYFLMDKAIWNFFDFPEKKMNERSYIVKTLNTVIFTVERIRFNAYPGAEERSKFSIFDTKNRQYISLDIAFLGRKMDKVLFESLETHDWVAIYRLLNGCIYKKSPMISTISKMIDILIPHLPSTFNIKKG